MDSDTTKNTTTTKLSPFESKIAQTILDKLDKQISLVKAASNNTDEIGNIKSGVIVLPPIKGTKDRCSSGSSNSTKKDFSESTENGNKSSLEGNYVQSTCSDDAISLEATLEYTKLRKEISETQAHSKYAAECSSSSSSNSSSQKFSEDVDFILNIIQKTKISLKEENDFTVLKEDILKASIHLNKEQQLKTDIKETKERIDKMKQEVRKREIEMSLEEQAKMGELGRLKDEHFVIQSEGKETLKFTDTYFKAQTCNTSCSHRDQVEREEKKIKQINQQIDRDVHCLAVMEAWTDDFCEQIEAKINEWKRKLRGDEMVMDMRIDAKRRAIQSQEELIKSLKETVCVFN